MAKTAFLTVHGEVEGEIEIKLEPSEAYDEVTENGFAGFDNTKRMPSTTDMGALNLWTSKATSCLIAQYKKYRADVGQTTKIRSMREMFEVISHEMTKYGFYFSAQKCENKWRVLERKYKNLVYRERLKKPGRIRHYGHWEHRRALDEIFYEKKRQMYLNESAFPPPSGSAKLASRMMPKSAENVNIRNNASSSQSVNNSNASSTSNIASNMRMDELTEQSGIIKSLFSNFVDEITKNFAVAERNNERRHKEELLMKQCDLEIQKRRLKLKEQKLELQKTQLIAAAQHLGFNIQ